MWIVYNKQDSHLCGWQVKDEQTAIQQCEENEELTYCYVDIY